MEKDKTLEQLIKENGLISAPLNFTGKVMSKLESESQRSPYKPLLGRGIKLSILITLVSVIVISIIFRDTNSFLAEKGFELPALNFSLQNFPELNITTGMLTALLAVFILVISDALVTNKRRMI